MMPKLPWSTAVVLVAALAAIVFLSVKEVDTTNLMLIVVSLIGGAGSAQLASIQKNTNGTQVKMLDELAENRRAMERILDKVASMQPPAPPEA